MRNRNARKMWRIWQPSLYVYCVTLQNRIEDKHINVLTFKLLDASLVLNYSEGFYFFSFKVNFFFCHCSALFSVFSGNGIEKSHCSRTTPNLCLSKCLFDITILAKIVSKLIAFCQMAIALCH